MKHDDTVGEPGDRSPKLEWVVAGLSGMAAFGATLCCFAAATALVLLNDGGGAVPSGWAPLLLLPIVLPIELLLAVLAAGVVTWLVFRHRNPRPKAGPGLYDGSPTLSQAHGSTTTG